MGSCLGWHLLGMNLLMTFLRRLNNHLWCRYFNAVQSETFPVAYGSDANMVSHYLWSSFQHGAGLTLLACIPLTPMYTACDMHLQVVAAPTGSGKTGILELAILRMLSSNMCGEHLLSHQHGKLKAIYLAPSKALVQVTRVYCRHALISINGRD